MVARRLDHDPEQLSLTCVRLLRYAEAKAVYDSANKDAIKAWRGSRMMALVEEFAAEAARAEIEAMEQEK